MKLFLSIFVWLSLACASAHAQFLQPLIVIRENQKTNIALQMCARALIERQEMIKDLVNEPMRIATRPEAQAAAEQARSNNKQVLNFIEVTQPPNDETMAGIPFAFRDAAHFLAFMESDLYQEAVDIKSGNVQTRLAFAYGGFFQVFSREAAVTEPHHLYKRWIGGTVQAKDTYTKFNAHIAPFSIGLYFFGQLDARDFAELANDSRTVNLVEAHLASAIDNGALRAARYVNLVSSAILPVEFVFGISDGFYTSNLNLVRTEKIRLWAETAARDCSEKIYQKELDVVKAFKEAGIQVIPFNRQSLLEESWRQTLTHNHIYWSNEQFDQLIRLGDFPKNARSPLQLLTSLSPADRSKAAEADRVARSRVASDAISAYEKNGDELYHAGEIQRALSYYMRVHKLDPNYKGIGFEKKLTDLGWILDYKDDPARALIAYRAAYKLNPSHELKNTIAEIERKVTKKQ